MSASDKFVSHPAASGVYVDASCRVQVYGALSPRTLGGITDIQEPSNYARSFRAEALSIRLRRDSWLQFAAARQGMTE